MPYWLRIVAEFLGGSVLMMLLLLVVGMYLSGPRGPRKAGRP